MYNISDQQIDFILDDIRARGVVTEGLQLNLLDHICCIIEQELEDNGDFERFYSATVRRFYKSQLSEIEEETHLLLNNKNYYVMKKVMINTGAFAAAALTFGIIFKYMHWVGASALITLGIGISSLVFLPLLVTLKIKEKQSAKDKLLIALGSASAIMMSLAVLFKVQHWPGANVMGTLSPALLLLVFLPVYFFSGIRNPETKVNTIVSSVLIVVGCGLFFTLVATPRSSRLDEVRFTSIYYYGEQIVQNEMQQVAQAKPADSASNVFAAGKKVFGACEAFKADLLEYCAGVKTVGSDFETKNELIANVSMQDYLGTLGAKKLNELSDAVFYYNKVSNAHAGVKPVPVKLNVLDSKYGVQRDRVMAVLNDLLQIQMLVLQNERQLSQPGKGEMAVAQ